MLMFKSIEICAGAGGQALGLELAGFNHVALVENDHHACETLRLNRPGWQVFEEDLQNFTADRYKEVDLVAGGVPCPPFSAAGQQLGKDDERNLFDEALRIVAESNPKAVMLENVRGLMDEKFAEYRLFISHKLYKMGYLSDWKLLQASDFGVPQLRPRVVLIAIKEEYADYFAWPQANIQETPTVGEALYDLMKLNGWPLADVWKERANTIAPTLVGGSKKHGGPDLGPTRAKKQWKKLGINAHLVQYESPARDFKGKEGFEDMPYLSLRMAARIQGFSDDWVFFGKKTHAYRQIGNAFPPPVAQAVGESIVNALMKTTKVDRVLSKPAIQSKQLDSLQA